MPKHIILDYLNVLAKSSSNDILPEQVKEILSTVFTGEAVPEKSLAEEIKAWVMSSQGDFLSSQIDKDLNLSSRVDKKNLSKILSRLVLEGLIERVGRKYGCFRRIERDSNVLDWRNADTSTVVDLIWPFHLERLVTLYPKNVIVVAGSPNAGKGHPHGTPIMTPTGWKNIEALKVGDEVAAGDGSWTKLKGVFHRGPQQIFRVEFSDKTWIECDHEHLWQVQREHGRGKEKVWDVLPTYALLARPYFRQTGRLQLPLAGVVQFEEQDVPIHPYVMGALFGDGNFSKKGSTRITSADQEVFDRIEKHNPLGKSGKMTKNNRCPSRTLLNLMPLIRDLGLAGKRSWEKHIPKKYLLNSYENRVELLRGIMDTDGTVSPSGKSVSFSSTSKQLSEDVMFLVRSLGEKAVMGVERRTYYTHNGEKKRGRISYRVHISIKGFNPFVLERKAARVTPFVKRNNKVIKTIVPVGIKDSICLSVEHPEGLYIAKDFIVTHNTALMLNLIRMNMANHRIAYFSSEMGPEELKLRLNNFQDVGQDEWKFEAYDRSGNFADVIQPNAINLIDYLEVTTDFFKVGGEIKTIFDKLDKGVAVIALQKKKGAEYGRGAEFSLEKARLYLSMDDGELKIVKAKNWGPDAKETGHNPNGRIYHFSLVGGCKFVGRYQVGEKRRRDREPGEEG